MAIDFRTGAELVFTSNAAQVFSEIAEKLEAFGRLLSDTTSSMERLSTAMADLGKAGRSVNRISDAMEKLQKTGGDAASRLDSAFKDLETGAKGVTDATKGIGTSLRDNISAARDLTQQYEDAAKAAREVGEAGASANRAAASGGGRGGHGGFGHQEALDTGIGLEMASAPVWEGMVKSWEQSAEYDHWMSVLRSDSGITDQQQGEINKRVSEVTRATPGSTLAGSLEVLGDAKGVLGKLPEAMEALPTMMRFVTGLQMADKQGGGKGDLRQAMEALKEIESSGGALTTDASGHKHMDWEKLGEQTNELLAIQVATRGRITPHDMLMTMRKARTQGMMLDDHAITMLPYFAQEMGPSVFGTALFSAMQVESSGRMDESHEQEFERLGLIKRGSGHMVKDKFGKTHFQYNPADLKDGDLRKHDPFKWIHDVMEPAIAKTLGVDPKTKIGEEAVLNEITKMAQRGTIAGYEADVIRAYDVAQKDADAIDRTKKNPDGTPRDQYQHFLETDPSARLQVMAAAWTNFETVMGRILNGPFADGMNKVTAALNTVADWAEAHPTAAARLVEATAAVTGLITALVPIGMTILFLTPAIAGLAGALGVLRAALAVLGLPGMTPAAKTPGTALTATEAAETGLPLVGTLGTAAEFGAAGIATAIVNAVAMGVGYGVAQAIGPLSADGVNHANAKHEMLFPGSKGRLPILVPPPAVNVAAPNTSVKVMLDGKEIAAHIETHVADRADSPPTGGTVSNGAATPNYFSVGPTD